MTLAASHAAASASFAASTASNPSATLVARGARGSVSGLSADAPSLGGGSGGRCCAVVPQRPFRDAGPFRGRRSRATMAHLRGPGERGALDDDVAEMRCVAARDEPTRCRHALRRGGRVRRCAFLPRGALRRVHDGGRHRRGRRRACARVSDHRRRSPTRIFVGAGDDDPWGADLGWDDDDDEGRHGDEETRAED